MSYPLSLPPPSEFSPIAGIPSYPAARPREALACPYLRRVWGARTWPEEAMEFRPQTYGRAKY